MKTTTKKSTKVNFFSQSPEEKYKFLICKSCNKVQVKVDKSAVEAICHICCASYGPEITKSNETTGFPRGWKFFKQFVHEDGRVFEKGVENPSLFNTLSPTVIEKKPTLTAEEKKKRKEEKEQHDLQRYVAKKRFKKEEKQKKSSKTTQENHHSTNKFFE